MLIAYAQPPAHGAGESKESDARYRGLLEAAPDAMVVVDESGEIVLLNVQAEKQFGYCRDELLGQQVKSIIPVGFAERLLADETRSAAEALAQQIGTGIELIGKRKDGSIFPIEIMLSPLDSAEGILVTAAIRDITARKAAAAERAVMEAELFSEKERAEVTLNCIGDGVACTDLAGKITFLNIAATTMTGWSWKEAEGQPMADVLRIVDVTNGMRVPDAMQRAVASNHKPHLSLNYMLIRSDGFETPIEDTVAQIHDRNGKVTGAVIVFRDVSAARQMALQVTHAAEHDYLTGLPNRMVLNDRVTHAIALAPRHSKKVVVLFLDLDGFKHINDTLGHAIGDRLLKSIAGRLVNCVRGADTVSRQGGDEFVILLSEVERPEDAAITARRMLKAIARPHSIDQHDLHVTASIGVSVFPDDGHEAETLIKNADIAMYQAKGDGRETFKFFKPAMNARAVERQSMEENLRRAIARDEFTLHYQPKFDLMTGDITGAEALMRWTHPTRGLVSPGEFVPIAEDSGLIVPIGRWVLREACRQAAEWRNAGMGLNTIAVNVSAIEFRNASYADWVSKTMGEARLNATEVELELTESVLMHDTETAGASLRALTDLGLRLTLDDFGTGFSSLSYLRRYPIHTLKIDQSFVRHLAKSRNDTALVMAIISMGRALGLRVVGEGIETREQMDILRGLGCDEGQGFYFSPPLPAKDFAGFLKLARAKVDSIAQSGRTLAHQPVNGRALSRV